MRIDQIIKTIIIDDANAQRDALHHLKSDKTRCRAIDVVVVLPPVVLLPVIVTAVVVVISDLGWRCSTGCTTSSNTKEKHCLVIYTFDPLTSSAERRDRVSSRSTSTLKMTSSFPG